MGFVLTDSVSADKSFPDFHARNSYLCNSYVTKYLPFTVDNKTQKGLPFNHVIKCGTKFFWSDLTAPAATTTWGNGVYLDTTSGIFMYFCFVKVFCEKAIFLVTLRCRI